MDNARGDRLAGQDGGGGGGSDGGGGTPGKVSLTSQMRRGPSVDEIADKVIQRLARGSGAPLEGAEAREAAAAGFAGGGSAPPQLDTIQRSFGHHDVSGTRAHIGGAAADASAALGARAYASGDQVAFAEQPDTFLIAHELAHVVQQRAGIHLSGGVGQAGDVHERHADAVAERVVRGESAEALLDQYSPSGGAPMIQRTPPNVIEERREPVVCEGGDPSDLSAHEHDLIRAFVERAQTLIAPWESQRQTSDLRFDDAEMRTHYRTFADAWLRDMSVQTDPTRPIAFELDGPARAEARRLLDAGTFRASVREIRAFNFSALQSYVDLLGLGPADRLMHRYHVDVVVGAQVGGEIGVGVEAQVRRYEITYDNDMGMHWVAHANAGTIGAGPGVSTIPVGANLDLGGGYEGESQFYFDSEDFDLAAISYLTVGGQALAEQIGVEALIFDNNGRRLEVHAINVGGGDRWGTDTAGSASVMVGGGMMDVTSVDRPEGRLPDMEDRPVEPPNTGAWVPMMAVMLYFETGEGTLDDADRTTLEDLVERMESFDDRNPGLLFRVHCQGRASRRWRGARDESEAIERNTALAHTRAETARMYMATQLHDVAPEFSTGVIPGSDFYETTTGGMSGETPDDDQQQDRAVIIAVEYNPCGGEGRADGGIRLH
jgi:hypothetical protein